MTAPILEKATSQSQLESCVTLHNVSWEKFEVIEAALEGISEVRLTYLDGILEIMTPLSEEHEDSKRTINLLLETYLYVSGIRFYARGSRTLGSQEVRGRKEPDDSYNLETKKAVPDIVIEVVVTSGGVNTLEIYKRLGVPEVWFWQDNNLSVYCLKEQGYEKCDRSILLPDLDLNLLNQYINFSDQYDAANEFRNTILSQDIAP